MKVEIFEQDDVDSTDKLELRINKFLQSHDVIFTNQSEIIDSNNDFFMRTITIWYEE